MEVQHPLARGRARPEDPGQERLQGPAVRGLAPEADVAVGADEIDRLHGRPVAVVKLAARVEQGDAVVFLEERVADQTFDAIHLFFPDPWRKKKHTKRRFVSPTNLDLLARVLKPGGYVLIATDQDFYAEHVLAEADAHPRFSASRIERPPWRPQAGFEAKGRAMGREIHELRLDLVD